MNINFIKFFWWLTKFSFKSSLSTFQEWNCQDRQNSHENTRWKISILPNRSQCLNGHLRFQSTLHEVIFPEAPTKAHNTSSSISIKLRKPLRKFPHVLHTAAAPTTAIRLRRAQIGFFSPALTHSPSLSWRSVRKRITNLNLNHMSLFSVPCVHMKLKEKKNLRRRNAHFFHRRSFSPLLPLASVQLPIYGRK